MTPSAPPPVVPDVLLIGAQKAGTTSLYLDLIRIEGIQAAVDKEPEVLARAGSPAEALAMYAKIFRRQAKVRPRPLLLDASTAYAKEPDVVGVAEMAAEVCPRARVVYMVRDPVDRAWSHYRHDRTLELEAREPEAALQLGSAYDVYGDYGRQLRPWLAHFSEGQVRILRLEEYRENREGFLRALVAWLGLAEALPSSEKLAEVFNRAEDKRWVPKPLEWVLASSPYQTWIRPLMSQELRLRLKALLPRARAPETGREKMVPLALAEVFSARYQTFLGEFDPLFLKVPHDR